MADPALLIRPMILEDLRRAAQSGFLYAVLDACDSADVIKKVFELPQGRAVSLFEGETQQQRWDVAPYLASVDAALLDWIVEVLWPQAWGILVFSKGGLGTLRPHLRRLLYVRAPDSDLWYFRFYDPRVLGRFLRVANDQQLRQMFGPVLGYGISDPESGGVKLFRHEPREAAAGIPATLLQLQPLQVAAFMEDAEEDLASRIAVYLRQNKPEETHDVDDAELHQRVRAGLARANQYGFEHEASFAAFVGLMFEFAPNFDEQKTIRGILTDQTIPPDRRLDRVVEIATDEDWAEAEDMADPSAWNRPADWGANGQR